MSTLFYLARISLSLHARTHEIISNFVQDFFYFQISAHTHMKNALEIKSPKL